MANRLSLAASSPEIVRAHQVGRSRWPGVLLALDDFAAQVVATPLDPDGLARYSEDVFIVCACLRGIDGAVDHFERDHLQHVLPTLHRFDLSPDLVTEIVQIYRAKLFSSPTPKLATYSASGPLVGWLRIGLMRTALSELRKNSRYATLQPDFAEELLRNTATPETHLLLADSRTVLKAAIESALGRLNARDRTLLRLYYLDGLNIERIAALFQIHRATVARRVLRLRDDALQTIKGALPSSAAGSPSSHVRSLWRIAGSDIQVSVVRLLKEGLSNVSSDDIASTANANKVSPK